MGDVGRGGANTCIVVLVGKRGKKTKFEVHGSAHEGDSPVREFQSPISPTGKSGSACTAVYPGFRMREVKGSAN